MIDLILKLNRGMLMEIVRAETLQAKIFMVNTEVLRSHGRRMRRATTKCKPCAACHLGDDSLSFETTTIGISDNYKRILPI